MQVVRSGLWTRRSVSIGVGSVSMGALRERLNDERRARERFRMHICNQVFRFKRQRIPDTHLLALLLLQGTRSS